MKAVVCLVLALSAAGTASADEVEAGIARARVLMEAGEHMGCVSELSALLEAHPEDPRPLRLLAYVLFDRLARPEEAVEALEGCLFRVPGDEYALELLANICDRSFDEGRFEVSRNCAKLLIRFEEQGREHRMRWAWAAYRLGEDPRAVRGACRELIERFPSFDRAYWLLARTLEEEGRFEEAIEVYRDLLEEHPGDLDVRLTVAHRLLWQRRDYDAAEDAYRSALEISDRTRDREAARDGLALVREQRERSERLRAHQRFLLLVLLGVLVGYAVLLGALGLATRPRG